MLSPRYRAVPQGKVGMFRARWLSRLPEGAGECVSQEAALVLDNLIDHRDGITNRVDENSEPRLHHSEPGGETFFQPPMPRY